MNPQRPLRVLLLCDRLDVAGGVERFVCQIASHFAEQGMDVAVGSVDTAAENVRYPLHPRVRVLRGARPLAHAEGGPRWLRGWRLLRQQWHIGRALSALTRAERPDVVVLNGLTTACSVLALDRRWIARTVCCDHNHFDARSRPWRRLRAWLYPKVGGIVSLTEGDAPRFRALNPRTVVIYNASNLHADAPAAATQPVVLAVGRHVLQKGFDLLVQAWAAVAAELPAARLRIVGDGPLLESTQRFARDLGVDAHIEWLAPTADIAHHYREAALFVLPSRYEGMPLALLEAQAMGVASVAFDCPTGPAEILSAESGRLVRNGDVGTLGRAMVDLLRDDALRARMAAAAIARSRALFSPERHAEQWVSLVREVAA